ncbi:MAG: TIGR00269 family protein [Thermodesulfobacteriota bacterium]|nr:TIGR00269 family protein [Thermodesulfobacteriota bacterium]
MKCRRCEAPAQVALPSHNTGFCRECFLVFFSRQVERAVRKHRMFTHKDKILTALSGGKDSLALFRELVHQGHDVTGLHVDLGIDGFSAKAREIVEKFCQDLGAGLIVVSLAESELAIPKVKAAVKRPICSMCGKIKRYYFNKTALDQGYTVLATGHNLDDEAGRLLANTLRWDTAYLSDQGPTLPAESGFAPKVKPLYRVSEFETANYCFLRGVEYHMDPCPYAKGAKFTFRKELMQRLEEKSPGSKIGFYEGFLQKARPAFLALEQKKNEKLKPCPECGYPTSAEICGICRLRRMLSE